MSTATKTGWLIRSMGPHGLQYLGHFRLGWVRQSQHAMLFADYAEADRRLKQLADAAGIEPTFRNWLAIVAA